MKKFITIHLLMALSLTIVAQNFMTIGEVFDFDIGDEFHITGLADYQPPNADRITILEKYYSADSNTLYYIRFHDSYYTYVENNELLYHFWTETDTVTYPNIDSLITSYTIWTTYDTSMIYYDTIIGIDEAYCDSLINGYSYAINDFEPVYYQNEFGKGLGLVKDYYNNPAEYSMFDNVLFYYEKNGVSCGTPDTTAPDNDTNVPDYFANNPKWRQSSACRFGGDCIKSEKYVYYLNGDSVIGDHTYQKVFRHGEFSHAWYYDPPIPDWCTESGTFDEFHCLVRQEDRKIFIRIWNEPDTLLYNFDLNVGDTLPITWNQWWDDIVVVSIDSLLVGDSYRQVFNLSQNALSPQLIEGIGHEGGFLEPLSDIFECGHYLHCFALNDITYYPEYGAPCDLTVDIQNIYNQEKIRYYPNPVSTELFIEHNFSEDLKQVVACNTSGYQIHLNFKQNVREKVTVDMSGLANGIYIIQLIGKGKIIQNFKIVKK